jgi:hypothetical protein
VHDNIIQVVRWLLNARVDTNATNLAGLTALDILQGQMQIDNNEIRDMLTSSLPRVRSHEVYLISLVLFCTKLEIFVLHKKKKKK